MTKVMVLDDEAAIRSFISLNLRRAGFAVVEAANGEEAIALVERDTDIAIALLDIMLPGIDGYEVCQTLRGLRPQMGIIMLTARAQEADRVGGFTRGADDYVIKPFSPSELVARVQALNRRVGLPATAEEVSSGEFLIRRSERMAFKDDVRIHLTPREYEILLLFMENPNRAISRDEILDRVWGAGYVGDPKVVDVNISRLRQKIEEDAANPRHIERVWGHGYRWRGGD
jgi:DNA-binding response OmpR family regulator